MTETTIETPRHDLESGPPPRRRRRGVRAAVGGLCVAAIACTSLLGSSASPASAEVVSGRAAILCEANRVRAYVPSPSHTRSTYARVRLDTLAQLFRYNAATGRWDQVASSGWWAYTLTNASGYPSQMWPYTTWAVTANNNVAMFVPFNVAPGYHYAVKTWVYDRGDGTMRSFWNLNSVANTASGTSCRVG